MALFSTVDPVSRQVKYSDLNISFAAHPVTKKLSVLKNNEAVVRAIKNLILTKKFERPYEPLYGSDVSSRLFELYDYDIAADQSGKNDDDLTAYNIKKDIEDAIKSFEPRVEIIDIKATSSNKQNGIDVTIYFFVDNKAEPTKLDLFLERTR
jgi:phage baseplate assembly protein W